MLTVVDGGWGTRVRDTGFWIAMAGAQSRLAVPLPVRGVAPAAWGDGQWPVALAVRGAGARWCLVSDGELVGGGWPECGGRHDGTRV